MALIISVAAVVSALALFVHQPSGGSGYLSRAVDIAIAKNFTPKSSLDNFLHERNPSKQYCGPRGKNGWFLTIRIDTCNFTRSYYTFYRYCNWISRTHSCAGIAVPQEYFDDEAFRRRLFSALMKPCRVFQARIIYPGFPSQRRRMEKALGCDNGADYVRFRVYLLVLKNGWVNMTDAREFE
ncbi:MAG: hypothetical protein GY927_15395, partial [bacterium]|nr:hypothetical protein [bacterium]